MLACYYMKKFIMDPFSSHTPSTYPTKAHKELFQAVLSLKNEKEAAAFFRDLLTMPELNEFANRWQIVKLLIQKKSYTNIATQLNSSTATVTRVAHWLHNGLDGYKLMADRLMPIKFKDSHSPKTHYTTGKSIGLKNPHIL